MQTESMETMKAREAAETRFIIVAMITQQRALGQSQFPASYML